jgi:hypothetical protein
MAMSALGALAGAVLVLLAVFATDQGSGSDSPVCVCADPSPTAAPSPLDSGDGTPVRVITQRWTDPDNDGQYTISNLSDQTIRVGERTWIVTVVIPEGREAKFTPSLEVP